MRPVHVQWIADKYALLNNKPALMEAYKATSGGDQFVVRAG